MSIGYAWEKTMKAMHGMATSPANINQRIADAYVFHLMHIEPDRDLPADLRPKLAEIREALTAKEAQGNEGRVQASAWAMSVDQAAEVARNIADLYDHVCVARGDD